VEADGAAVDRGDDVLVEGEPAGELPASAELPEDVLVCSAGVPDPQADSVTATPAATSRRNNTETDRFAMARPLLSCRRKEQDRILRADAPWTANYSASMPPNAPGARSAARFRAAVNTALR
jgi:hypothetical protein